MPIVRQSPVAPGALLAEKYLVEEVLGAGAMGVVVAARHIDLDQRVAIKFLTSNTPGHGERFLREARATVRLRSEHAARVFDVGTIPDGTPFMVLELLEGHDLAQLIRDEAPLPVAVAADLVIQTCEAVAEAHALGIVHRDIKPQNLFLTRGVTGEGIVKVLDFGIAKSLEFEEASALTQTSALMGSPMYMSPEMMRSARNVLPQNDIWALGVVLQELLTRRLPFDGEAFPELCLKVVHAPPRSPLEDRADLPAGIVAIIGRCLAKDPADRFATAADLATELEPFAPPGSRVVAERARHLSAHAGARGMFGTSPTLQSLGPPPSASRSLSALAPVSVRLPASDPLPQPAEQPVSLAATGTPQVLDSPPSGTPLPPASAGPWILGSIAIVCLTVVIGGVMLLSRNGRAAAEVPPQQPAAILSAAASGPPSSAPPQVTDAASAPTTTPPAPTAALLPPSAAGSATPFPVKAARSAASKRTAPASTATGDEIPSLRLGLAAIEVGVCAGRRGDDVRSMRYAGVSMPSSSRPRSAARDNTLATLVVAAVVSTATPARAQGDSKTIAEALFQEGRRLVGEKKLAEACPKFAESQRIDPSSGTLLNLANCYEQIGRVATAWATYKEAASSAQAAGRADNLATAQKRAEALASRLPRVRVRAPNAPPGLVIERDGALLQLAVLDVPLPIDPGEHTLAASAPGKRPWSQTIRVPTEPAEQTITIPILEDAPPSPPSEPSAATSTAGAGSPPPSPVESGWSTQRSVGVGLIGLGVVGLGAGAYFAVSAKGKYDDSIVGCSAADKNVCNAVAVDRRESARQDGNIATVAVGVGAAAVAAGVFFVVRGARPSPQVASSTAATAGAHSAAKAAFFSTWTPAFGPRGVSLSGAF